LAAALVPACHHISLTQVQLVLIDGRVLGHL
jgi:hypothetical protein